MHCDIFAAVPDIRKTVAEPHATEYCAGSGLHRTLCALQYNHIVGFATGLTDSRDHRDKKHSANATVILGIFSAKVLTEPKLKPWLSVPAQGRQVIAHRMKGSFMCTKVDGAVYSILADLLETRGLQQFLQRSH